MSVLTFSQAPALRFPRPRPVGHILNGPPREEWASCPAPELSMVTVPTPLGLPDDDVRYWDRGVDLVPLGTGALSVMDCADLVDACRRLNQPLPLSGRVLDIGCGTGRWQRYCSAYIGLDINPSAVEFCRRRGVAAHVIGGYGPSALDGWLGGCEWISCFSVFTHVPFEVRHDYLEAFRRCGERLLVDIIPGDGAGDITRWTANVVDFETDLLNTGWRVDAVADRIAPGGSTHRYYRCSHL